MRFRATVELNGKTATGITVPAAVVTSLGAGRQPLVRVTINGHTYRSKVAVRGDRFLVGVSAENRERARVAAGDDVDVGIEVDTEPREVTVPPDFAGSLDRDAEAKRSFAALSYSKQQRLVLGIESAKKAETRQRRIDDALALLREGKA